MYFLLLCLRNVERHRDIETLRKPRLKPNEKNVFIFLVIRKFFSECLQGISPVSVQTTMY